MSDALRAKLCVCVQGGSGMRATPLDILKLIHILIAALRPEELKSCTQCRALMRVGRAAQVQCREEEEEEEVGMCELQARRDGRSPVSACAAVLRRRHKVALCVCAQIAGAGEQSGIHASDRLTHTKPLIVA